jgi:diaminopimelate epimerase
MRFVKMEGAGNDYIYVDVFEQKVHNPEKLAIRLSDRHFGIGADGLILVAPSDKADARMIMYNADGSSAEMCGNGVRCVAKFVYDRGIKRAPVLRIETGAGVKDIEVFTGPDGLVESARVDMGAPFLKPAEIPCDFNGDRVVGETLEIDGKIFEITCAGMGNPHCVIYVDDVDNFPVMTVGPLIEKHAMFPRRTNVEFVQILSKAEVRQRTWERGSGETLACGTGASAVCVAGVLTGRTNSVIKNRLSGGALTLEWGGIGKSVFKTGPCVTVFEGEISV